MVCNFELVLTFCGVCLNTRLFENEKVKNYIELCQKHYISTGMYFKANTNIRDL